MLRLGPMAGGCGVRKRDREVWTTEERIVVSFGEGILKVAYCLNAGPVLPEQGGSIMLSFCLWNNIGS